MNQREMRIARNEALFREVNERANELNARWDAGGALEASFSIICECGDDTCTEQVVVPRAAYSEVRNHGSRFIVLPGHELPDVERVLEATAAYAIVEKIGAAKDYVERRHRE